MIVRNPNVWAAAIPVITAIAVAVALLAGCATGKGQIVTGGPVMAPGGFSTLCAEAPGPECGKLK